jgi:hypothetical protein
MCTTCTSPVSTVMVNKTWSTCFSVSLASIFTLLQTMVYVWMQTIQWNKNWTPQVCFKKKACLRIKSMDIAVFTFKDDISSSDMLQLWLKMWNMSVKLRSKETIRFIKNEGL